MAYLCGSASTTRDIFSFAQASKPIPHQAKPEGCIGPLGTRSQKLPPSSITDIDAISGKAPARENREPAQKSFRLRARQARAYPVSRVAESREFMQS